MTVIGKLSSSLGHKDEVPNQKLAEQIAQDNDKDAVHELIDNLSNKNKDIQNDCIKVLYEIGERKPLLITPYIKNFVELLNSRNNRLQWGAMTAVASVTGENPRLVYSHLARIIEAADSGSVITRDQAVNVLIKLCAVKQYTDKAFALLIEQLLQCPTNQLPMYAENAVAIVADKNKSLFVKTLSSRLDEIEKDSKRKRVERVIKKMGG